MKKRKIKKTLNQVNGLRGYESQNMVQKAEPKLAQPMRHLLQPLNKAIQKNARKNLHSNILIP